MKLLSRNRIAYLVPAIVARSILAMALVVIVALPAFLIFDHFYPLPPVRPVAVSAEVVDADGKLLRAFASEQGRWRLETNLDNIDSEFLTLLIAYEDQRFWTHPGVDIRAFVRAMGQLVVNQRIISGGSTITMQLARLLEPREHRSIKAKIWQSLRAIQLEQRFSKREILQLYLTLAPYGGNLEGIRAASLAWFGKEPKELTLAQSALLVALPQSPEKRRPDRNNVRAKEVRNIVLARAARVGAIVASEVERAKGRSVPHVRIALPDHAAHLAQRLRNHVPNQQRHKVTLKREIQLALERVARQAADRLGEKISVAMVLADAGTGNILASVGSPNYLSQSRSGWLDMTRAIRSPGSALKPLIYGLAFEEGLVMPETLIMDAPANFAGYRPQNFDMKYQGEISVRKALQLSLNVPAVHLLEAVGPARLLSKFRRGFVKTIIPQSKRPGLAIGLGGIGISLRDLTQLYTVLANGGEMQVLRDVADTDTATTQLNRIKILQPVATWQVTDILSGVRAPNGSQGLKIAYKTGTSYGYRDAWSIGYDGRHVLGVWVGRADNGSVPGITGFATAAPILFEAFAKSGLKITPFKSAPKGANRVALADLPFALQKFKTKSQALVGLKLPEPPPQIVYPPEGARVELGRMASGQSFPLVVKLQNGRPPFRWIANGNLIAPGSRKRKALWRPDGSGFSSLTVIDAGGRAASVNLYIDVLAQ